MTRSAAAVVALALVVTGCAVAPRSPADPGTASPSASVSASAEAAKEGVRTVDRGMLPTLTDGLLKVDQVSANVPTVPSLRTLTVASGIVRAQLLRSRTAEQTSVAVDWALISASPDAAGFLVTTKLGGGKADATKVTSIWFDNLTNRAVGPAALIRPGYYGQLIELAKQIAAAKGLDAAKVIAYLRDRQVPLGSGPAFAFAANGDLLLVFSGRTLTDAAEPVTLTVPAAETTTLLNEFGLRAQAGATRPSANSALVTGATQPDPERPASGAADDRPSVELTPDCVRLKCVALSFDDGPIAESLATVRALQEGGAGATFFALGDVLKASSGPLASVAAAGMDVQSHTWQHVSLVGRSDQSVNDQLTRNADAIERVTGLRPTLVRPPYGAKDTRVAGLIGSQGAAIANWTVDTLDWQSRDTAKIVAAATNPSPGDIVLMHDIYPTTAAAVPGILAALKQKGFTVVTVSELAPPGSFQSGVAYCSSPLRKNSKC